MGQGQKGKVEALPGTTTLPWISNLAGPKRKTFFTSTERKKEKTQLSILAEQQMECMLWSHYWFLERWGEAIGLPGTFTPPPPLQWGDGGTYASGIGGEAAPRPMENHPNPPWQYLGTTKGPGQQRAPYCPVAIL